MPYIAVIIDSFRAALSSKVLWFAIAVIWITLAALAPFGVREDLTWKFSRDDFRNGRRFKAMLAETTTDEAKKTSALGRITEAMPEETLKNLKKIGEGEDIPIFTQRFADGLNKMIEAEIEGEGTWYDEEAWKDIRKVRERRELEESTESLTEMQQRRLARLRLEAAAPGVFQPRSSISTKVMYLGYEFPAALPFDKSGFRDIVNQFVYPTIISLLLGFIFVFLGIIVTAPIIPGMLQAGSLHLLLSKPISRSGLLTSKFLGGCSFMLLCVVQLVVGLYLVSGMRLGIWNARLLWCIPASVLLFSVFYAVSVAAGLIYRSEVLSIVVTCVFGGIVFLVGFFGGIFEGLVANVDRVNQMTVVNDTIFARTASGEMNVWNPSGGRWDPIFENENFIPSRPVMPVAVEKEDGEGFLALTANSQRGGGRFFGSGKVNLQSLDSESNWEAAPGIELPSGTEGFFVVGDQLIAVSSNGINSVSIENAIVSEEEKEAEEAAKAKEDGKEEKTKIPSWMNLSSMMGAPPEGFKSILPKDVKLEQPLRVVMTADESFVIGSSDILYKLGQEDDQTWKLVGRGTIDGPAFERFRMGSSNAMAAIAKNEEPMQFIDLSSMKTVATYDFEDGERIQNIVAMSDKSFAILRSDGYVTKLDVEAAEVKPTTLSFSEVDGISWAPGENVLLVAHHIDKIAKVNPSDLSTSENLNPKLGMWRNIYSYGIVPLRFIVPQTGELGNVMTSFISDRSSVTIEGENDDETQTVRYNLFRPLVSCSCFILVVMGLNILYFRSKDF